MSRIVAALAATALVIAACGGGAAPTPTGAATSTAAAATAAPAAATAPATQAAVRTNIVTLEGFSFGPPAIAVAVGTTVAWTNKDGTAHTVTSGILPGTGSPSGVPDGKFDKIVDGQGGTFTFTFTQAGTVTYFCRFHSNMRGSVEVR